MQWLNREIIGPKNTQNWHHFTRTSSSLIETLYRENVSFRDRDLKCFKRCHMASENFDAELLLNIRVSI